MAINPENITTIRVDQLANLSLTLDSLFPHTNGTELVSSSINDLVTLVASTIETGTGVGYLPISVTDGQQLPDIPENPSFFLCGVGTFLNVNGFPDIICTEALNAIMSVDDHWAIAVEIPIAPLSGAVQSVTGSAVDNTDPQNPVINLSGAVTSVNGETGAVVVGGDNIGVTDPTTSSVDTLNTALQNIFDSGGGATPDLQQVIEAGDELVSDDNLRKIVISKEGQSISFYSRADVGDAWTLISTLNGVPTLDEVLTEENIARQDIKVSYGDGARLVFSDGEDSLGAFYGNSTGFGYSDDTGLSSAQANFIISGLTTARNYTLPDKDGTFAMLDDLESIVVSSNTTAVNDTNYTVVANATFTDPTPVEGKGYIVFVRNGTATIGGTGYGVGSLVYRVYHSGAWNNTVYIDQTQVVKANRYIYQGKTSITGVTGETNICSFKIPAGAYSNTDAFKLDFTPTKSVTASTSTFKVYIGLTSGARTNTIAQTALGTTGRASDNTRRFFIDAGSLDSSVLFTTNANSGLGSQTSVNTPISVNMANDLWITITANPTATGEIHGVMGVSITPLK